VNLAIGCDILSMVDREIAKIVMSIFSDDLFLLFLLKITKFFALVEFVKKM
jgi:hypothetical protein